MGSHYKGTAVELRALDAYIKLVRAAETVGAKAASHLMGGPVTPLQFGVLEALYHLGPMRLCDLAVKHLRSRGTLTVVVDNLEKSGLVSRQASTVDRRAITVHLTQAGMDTIEILLPVHAAAVTECMRVLTDDEQVILGRLCKKVGLGEPPSAA
ncbi:MAG: MarR family winged helix-turn-helix transcriptional regulator [Capsulimonadaceae bacterium]